MITQKNVTIETKKYPNGQVRHRNYKRCGLLHRDPADGPAAESFYEDGQLAIREYFSDGIWHRPVADGPAYESFNSTGRVVCREFYVYGDFVAAPPDLSTVEKRRAFIEPLQQAVNSTTNAYESCCQLYEVKVNRLKNNANAENLAIFIEAGEALVAADTARSAALKAYREGIDMLPKAAKNPKEDGSG